MDVIEQVKQMKIEEAKNEGFRKGLRMGQNLIRAKKITFVRNLLKETNFFDKKIAALADVSEAFVKQLKGKM